MNKPVAYLQGPDGQEFDLHVTSPDPDDGTYCLHIRGKDHNALARHVPTTEWWVRIVPNENGR